MLKVGLLCLVGDVFHVSLSVGIIQTVGETAVAISNLVIFSFLNAWNNAD